MSSKRPVVVVVGSGFAGIKAVRGLRKSDVDVILVDRRNYHVFQPLLYQVATAVLSPADIAYPIRSIFRKQKNVAVVLTDIDVVDLANKRVGTTGTTTIYDYLVIAVGATHSYFGKPEWAKFAPGLKTIEDATEIRRRMLLAYEEAEYEADEAARRAKLTFVVVGGGPTGVEMAGAMREIAAETMQRDFRTIDTKTARIVLVQGGDRLLPSMDPKLGARAKADLEADGVEVRLDARVTNVDEAGVWIGDEQLRANNVIWAAGVQGSPLLAKLGVPTDRSGRVIVNKDLSVPGHPEVFVVGDAAAVNDAKTGQPVPGLAPAAMQAGTFVAKIIASEVAGKSKPSDRPGFHYFDKGTLATIGTHRAVADIKGLRFGGFIAWLMWCFVHLMFLISFRSKILVMLNWMYEYLTNGREARLITGDTQLKISKIRVPEE